MSATLAYKSLELFPYPPPSGGAGAGKSWRRSVPGQNGHGSAALYYLMDISTNWNNYVFVSEPWSRFGFGSF